MTWQEIIDEIEGKGVRRDTEVESISLNKHQLEKGGPIYVWLVDPDTVRID